VHQLLHRVQPEETSYTNVFLQPDHVSSKHELPISYTVAVLTALWPFVQTCSERSSLELRNFLRHFPAGPCFKYNCIKTDAVQQCT
jgi:hypothetical protein